MKTESLCIFDELAELAFELGERVVRADALEPGFLEGVAEFSGCLVVIACRFHFFVSGGGKLVEGALKVFRQQIAHGIELQADWQFERGRGKTVDASERGDGGSGCLEKCTARGRVDFRLAP